MDESEGEDATIRWSGDGRVVGHRGGIVAGRVQFLAVDDSATGGGATGGTKIAGGTATWAEAPNTQPNYIFPFMSLAYFSVANINQFQFLMYRPLYWFGNGAQPTLNPSPVPGRVAGVLQQQHDRGREDEALQVVQR